MLFIDARGPYLAERQLYAVVAVVLNFHAKTELETLQSGAGRPLPGLPAWDFLRLQPPFSWTLLISSWCQCGLLGFNAEIYFVFVFTLFYPLF